MRRKGSGPKLVALRLVPLRESRRCVPFDLAGEGCCVVWRSRIYSRRPARYSIRMFSGTGEYGDHTKHQFAFRIDTWTPDGESIVEQVALVEDYKVALATFRAACERWPNTPITLRQGARVIEDSRSLRLAWSDKGRQGGR
jgi:hypothetical protein